MSCPIWIAISISPRSWKKKQGSKSSDQPTVKDLSHHITRQPGRRLDKTIKLPPRFLTVVLGLLFCNVFLLHCTVIRVKQIGPESEGTR